MNDSVDIVKIIEEQMKNNPQELKKLKKKMRKWNKQPGSNKKIETMLRAFGANIPSPPAQSQEEHLEPRDILRKKLKDMKDKRTGRK